MLRVFPTNLSQNPSCLIPGAVGGCHDSADLFGSRDKMMDEPYSGRI